MANVNGPISDVDMGVHGPGRAEAYPRPAPHQSGSGWDEAFLTLAHPLSQSGWARLCYYSFIFSIFCRANAYLTKGKIYPGRAEPSFGLYTTKSKFSPFINRALF